MSKKVDYVYTNFYAPHLQGGKPLYRSNPQKNTRILIERMYWRMLTELSLNRFKWHGLPTTVDERFLELSLMRHGGVLFFLWDEKAEIMGERYLVSQFVNTGNINHYDNPTRFRVVNAGGVQGEYGPNDAVPIWGNYLRQPDMDIIQVYTRRLTELDTTIDVNTINMRYPRILAMGEEMKLSMENFNRQIQEGVPTIKVNEMNNPSIGVGTLDMGSHHETIPGLLAAKGKMWNDALMMLGVPTMNQDKKERQIVAEAETGKDQSEVIRNIALNSREQACEQINNMFGLDVSVEWRADDEQQQLAEALQAMMGGGETSGNIHDDTE